MRSQEAGGGPEPSSGVPAQGLHSEAGPQIPLSHSTCFLHPLPVLHFAGQGPPQSTSLSPPFWIPSLQVSEWSGLGWSERGTR